MKTSSLFNSLRVLLVTLFVVGFIAVNAQTYKQATLKTKYGTTPEYASLYQQIRFERSIYYGDSYWDYLTLSSTDMAMRDTLYPTLRAFNSTGVYNYAYNHQTSDDNQYGTIVLPLTYKAGGDIWPYVHFALSDAGSAGDTLVLALEYMWGDDKDVLTTDTITTEIVVTTYKAWEKNYENLGKISGLGMEEGSVIGVRFTRLQSDASDTYADWMQFFDLSFKYEVDKPGADSYTD